MSIAVTYLYFPGCPSHEEGLRRLHAAADVADIAISVTPRMIHTDDEAHATGFVGSPTYIIEGRDLVPPTPHMAFRADACRTYVQPDGRQGPLPSVGQIRDGLTTALAP